jgi:NADH:ubiquinone oxidoreductase subunit 5 (subunit L)/multisubunit Na+/H+ antiporter MnhA subunit
MADALHPAASHHLPSFITAPGETDVLMVIMTIFLVVAVLAFGLLFLRLHTLPERMAHKSQKLQFEIVAVLGLIALFTHMHIFWVIGLILAFIEFPDFGTPLRRIAGSAEKMAGLKPGEGAAEMTPQIVAADTNATAPVTTKDADTAATTPQIVAEKRKELGRA